MVSEDTIMEHPLKSPSLGLGVFSTVVTLVTLTLSAKWAQYTTKVSASYHTDANLLHGMGDEVRDMKSF